MKKKLTVGILAHVDAGKTTLSEALLYVSGRIRTLGRVDHGNTFLDTDALERERGITIFSKQARFSTANTDLILLDTPGHVDLSAETERTLSLLDYAILVVSAPDGIQNHTRTLWELLSHYRVPTFIFVNKTDVAVKPREKTEQELVWAFGQGCVAFFEDLSKAQLDEKLALTSEEMLEAHLSGEDIPKEMITDAILERRLFPCIFGSALKTDGVSHLLDALDVYTASPIYGNGFGARVFKIARSGNVRLTYMKITGGELSARDEISYLSEDGRSLSEKITQLRLYSGEKFSQVDRVSAGDICAAVGLTSTFVGQGLGAEIGNEKPLLEPVVSYRMVLPEGSDPVKLLPALTELTEEEPTLHLLWNERLSQIEVRLMGEIQTDLIKHKVKERLNIDVDFDAGNILYKEKASSKSIGVGHFEPLRHYAEVQLLIEPQPKGTGLIFDTHLPENSLDTSWQRLILSHLYEKAHIGITVGAPLTDTKITLIAGKAHLKHTEGGDFREATLRAVRCGLMRSGCTLLEPYYKFRLSVPSASVGRAMSDLQTRNAEFSVTGATDGISVIEGRAPAATLHGYQREVISYTRGVGTISCVSDGYEPCHNSEQVTTSVGYDPEGDLENPPHSVFCANGAGFTVPWTEVDSYKHLEADVTLTEGAEVMIPKVSSLSRRYSISEKEIEQIMLRTFGQPKKRVENEPKRMSFSEPEKHIPKKVREKKQSMTIIDGYNVIYAFKELRSVSAVNLEKARQVLDDILANYVAYTKREVTLVYDAYRVKHGTGSDNTKNGYRTVFTAENETADAYIEKMMQRLGPNYNIRVVTDDRLLQFSAVHSGISRMTAEEFEEEIIKVGQEITEYIKNHTK